MISPSEVEPDRSKWDHSGPDPIVVTCSHCDSADVTRDAVVRWDIQSQTWQLSNVFDNGDCGKCDTTARLEDTPLLEFLGKELLNPTNEG